jgi:hypothetical protein
MTQKARITNAKQIFLENPQKIGVPQTPVPFRAKFLRITRETHALVASSAFIPFPPSLHFGAASRRDKAMRPCLRTD